MTPTFTVLDEPSCEALLESSHVGRLAYTFRDRVDIEPVHYVYRDRGIYGRMQPGTKVGVLAHHPWVAFEVDDVTGLFDWRSVVVHGRVEFPLMDGPHPEQKRAEAAIAQFRTLVPEAFTADDPTPKRELVFLLPVHEISGRMAQSHAV